MEQVPTPANDLPRPFIPPPELAESREPATGAALWPTFMRRTLAEEALRLAPGAGFRLAAANDSRRG